MKQVQIFLDADEDRLQSKINAFLGNFPVGRISNIDFKFNSTVSTTDHSTNYEYSVLISYDIETKEEKLDAIGRI